MNFSSHNVRFTACICLFLASIACTTEAIPSPWYQHYFHQLNGAHYKENCLLIDFAQNIRYASSILYYRISHKQSELDQALLTIENKLKNFHDRFITLEQTALISIKEKYKMSDAIWQKCVSDIEQIKKIYNNGMLHTYDNVIHDNAIDNEIMQSLIVLLTENGINPNSINLLMASEQEASDSPSLMAQAICPLAYPKQDEHGDLIFSQQYIPTKIKLFPCIKNKTFAEKISCCAHEIQHVISLHSVTNMILTEYLAHYYSIDEKEFKKSMEYRQLCRIQEAQAEILSAIKSPHVARCMKQFRQQNYYPNHLYEEHFYDIATIDMLWKVRDKLESLYFVVNA